MKRIKVLTSVSYAQTLSIPSVATESHEMTTLARHSDWGLTGIKKYIHHSLEALQLLVKARSYDVLVLCTASLEVFFCAIFRGIICSQTRLIVFDFLAPKQSKVEAILGRALKHIDMFLCIRKGDIEMVSSRYAVPRSQCDFAYFPMPSQAPAASREDGYIYSAGWAHRDWPLLIQALLKLPYKAYLSAGGNLDVPASERERIKVLPMQSPEQGRELMSRASLVVVPIANTTLPAGPLIVLDAIALGKAVIATDVNGTRDYIRNRETGILVPPGDVDAMADAIKLLMEDGALRARMASCAQELAKTEFSMERLVEKIMSTSSRLSGRALPASSAAHDEDAAHDGDAAHEAQSSSSDFAGTMPRR